MHCNEEEFRIKKNHHRVYWAKDRQKMGKKKKRLKLVKSHRAYWTMSNPEPSSSPPRGLNITLAFLKTIKILRILKVLKLYKKSKTLAFLNKDSENWNNSQKVFVFILISGR